ncbi:MAG: hypothetical protein GF313_09415, partial [Caldithrix sp.]|nr:hypothetical protein [Caldithrix sp.]
DIEYVAVSQEAKMSPSAIHPYRKWNPEFTDASLLNKENSANYIIITTDLLLENARRLKALKEQDGLKTEVVTVDNIYDTFNYGIKSPLAIKEFIRYALYQWEQSNALQYVVLVGDASSNYKSNADQVPTFLYQTVKFGASAADYWYALLSGEDYIPDVTVSRIPASTNAELVAYLDKLENFNSSESIGEWQNRTLFLSGNDGGTREVITNKPVFRAQNLRLINRQLPEGLFSNQINTVKNTQIEGYDEKFGSTTDLIEYFDEGVSYINFFGHGGGAIWADVQLLGLDDVDRMNNGSRLPFVTSMTCFTGAFENQGRQSLSEKLILTPEKGAIAILGASGVGWLQNDYTLAWGVFDYLWHDDITIGQAVDLMKMSYLSSPFYYTDETKFYTYSYNQLKHSLVTQYNLLGDPALKLPKPQSELNLTADRYSVYPGDSINIYINGNLDNGNGRLNLTDNENYQIDETLFSLNSESSTFGFRVPDSGFTSPLHVKAYASNLQQDANGYLQIAVEKPLVRKIITIPSHPQINDSVRFNLIVDSVDPIENISLTNFETVNNNIAYTADIEMIQKNDSVFTSNSSFGAFKAAGEHHFDIEIQYAQGEKEILRWQSLFVDDDRPDLLFESNSIAYDASDGSKIRCTVMNQSDESLSDVNLNFYVDAGPSWQMPHIQKTLQFQSNDKQTITLPLPDSLLWLPAEHTFKWIIDADSTVDERSETNNTAQKTFSADRFLVSHPIGTTADGVSNDSVSIDNGWSFYVAKDSARKNTVVKFEERDIGQMLSDRSQGALTYVSPAGRFDSSAIFLTMQDHILSALLSMNIDVNAEIKPDVSFYRLNHMDGLWYRVRSQFKGDRLQANIRSGGLYAVFYSSDKDEPTIEVTTNGRPLIGDMLVFRNPSISLLLQDENGVDLKNSLDLKIDNNILVSKGMVMESETVTLPDSVREGKAVSVILNPEFDPGDHRIEVKVADASGNLSTQTIEFTVAQTFDIRVFGNYPNPFQDKTIFSFFIDNYEPIDDLDIKIYTASGRLIRKKMLILDESIGIDHNIRDPFYHELIWDGTDDEGVEVANGVYFAIIKGKYKNKTVKKTLKVAKLK